MNKEELVKGGCGRQADAVVASAIVTCACMVGAIVVIVAAFIAQ